MRIQDVTGLSCYALHSCGKASWRSSQVGSVNFRLLPEANSFRMSHLYAGYVWNLLPVIPSNF
jgi:hypothetical protein